MIDVSELMRDPDFAQDFAVKRQVGAWAGEGAFTTTETDIPRVGIIQPAKVEDIVQFLPEGERNGNFIAIYCDQDLLMGNGNDQQSDVIVWKGNYFRIAKAKQWEDHGYWYALAKGFVNG